MAHNFKVFGESTVNIYNDSQYASSSERINGSQPATPVVSKLMNTALKSASMVTAALMSVVTQNQSNTVGVQSAQNTIVEYITQGLISFIDANVGYSFSSSEDSITGDILTLKVGSSTKTVTIKNAAHATKAYNVSNQINGKNISDIFETDGTTAKKATLDANGNEIAGYYNDAYILTDGTKLVLANGYGEENSITLPNTIKSISFPTAIPTTEITSGSATSALGGAGIIVNCPQLTITYLDGSTSKENCYMSISNTNYYSQGYNIVADARYATEIIVHSRIYGTSQAQSTFYNSLNMLGQTIEGNASNVGNYIGRATRCANNSYFYEIRKDGVVVKSGTVSMIYYLSTPYVPVLKGVEILSNDITYTYYINFGRNFG